MKRIVWNMVAVAFSTLFFLSAPASADDKEAAVKMVKSCAAFYKANGMEKTLDAINDLKGEFVKGELYVAALSFDGTLMAKGFGQNQVGQNTMDVPDAKGKKFRREKIERAQKDGSGWVDYVFVNPKTKELEDKMSYFEKVDELVLTVGIYSGKSK